MTELEYGLMILKKSFPFIIFSINSTRTFIYINNDVKYYYIQYDKDYNDFWFMTLGHFARIHDLCDYLIKGLINTQIY